MKAHLNYTAKQIVCTLIAISLSAVAPLASGGPQTRSAHPVLVMNRTITSPVTDSILSLNVYGRGLVTVSRVTFPHRIGQGQKPKRQVVDFAFLEATVTWEFQQALIAAGCSPVAR